MLAAQPSFERIALNRVTFGARDLDVSLVQRNGWRAWVEEQLANPAGDDPELAAFLAKQTMHIAYPGQDNGDGTGYRGVDEDRPFNYMKTEIPKLYNMAYQYPRTIPWAEQLRIQQELVATIWMRNAHSRFQVREFMVDFWINHFSIGVAKNQSGANMLPRFYEDVIRPNAMGNFRTLLEGVVSHPCMLLFLDNALSEAKTPNENYARELMELHTLGADAYLGKHPNPGDTSGFSDADVIQVARALSGWTIEMGQQRGEGWDDRFPTTGKFFFNPRQHNSDATSLMGQDLSAYRDMAQGQRVLDILANHDATAAFITRKMCVRMFGDNPPDAVLARAKKAFADNRNAPDQMKQVLRAILLDGPEIGTGPQVKVRRPHERAIALFRTTDLIANAEPWWQVIVDPVNDVPFTWPTPDGRPDTNAHWLNTWSLVTFWNFLPDIICQPSVGGNLMDQPPASAYSSVASLVEYWADRMLGYGFSPAVMDAFVKEFANFNLLERSALANTESYLRRMVVGTIAGSPQFGLR
jgi:uncharacterized protein (DUF1800 family)